MELNKYGFQVGYRTPEKSLEYREKILELTGIRGEDASWHNEPCDSLYYEGLNLYVYLPNSDKNDHGNEEWACFGIYPCDSEGAFLEPKTDFILDTFEEVVEYIKSIKL